MRSASSSPPWERQAPAWPVHRKAHRKTEGLRRDYTCPHPRTSPLSAKAGYTFPNASITTVTNALFHGASGIWLVNTMCTLLESEILLGFFHHLAHIPHVVARCRSNLKMPGGAAQLPEDCRILCLTPWTQSQNHCCTLPDHVMQRP